MSKTRIWREGLKMSVLDSKMVQFAAKGNQYNWSCSNQSIDHFPTNLIGPVQPIYIGCIQGTLSSLVASYTACGVWCGDHRDMN